MTDMDFSISENTQATLLLCGTLGKDNGATRPLTLPQYNAVVQALVSLNKRPSDLLHDAGLAETVCSIPVENARLKEPASADRLKTLLDRGFALSMALNRWAQYGVRPVGRGDDLYPARMKLYLKGKAPAVLYYAGNDQLWSGGGMACVGSRTSLTRRRRQFGVSFASVWMPTCSLCREGQEAPTKLPCGRRLSAGEASSRHCPAIC